MQSTASGPRDVNRCKDASPRATRSGAGSDDAASGADGKGKARAEAVDGLAYEDDADVEADVGDEADDAWCLICHTSPIADRTVLPSCLHAQFCFACIVRWSGIRRTCPLCLHPIGEYVIHSIRDDDDYVRYYLPPTASTSTASTSNAATTVDRRSIVATVQRTRAARALAHRSHIYRHALYAKHIGSNRHTGFRPAPTPTAIRHDVRNGGGIARRITTFLRRELQVWPHVDVEFVAKYVLSLMQVWRVGDDEMVKLVAEVLGVGEGTAKHMLHELECWLRSGRGELRWWDAVVQYPRPGEQVDYTAQDERSAQEQQSQMRAQVAAKRELLLERLEREKRLLL